MPYLLIVARLVDILRSLDFARDDRVVVSPPYYSSDSIDILRSFDSAGAPLRMTGKCSEYKGGWLMVKKESDFQSGLIKELKKRYEGCMVLKNDPNYKQGIPDLTVLYRDRWAALECKRGEKEKHQPNQDYYVGKMNEMSYSAFIFPENREQVLRELDEVFL